jgi:hypothetical protein
MGFSLHPFLLDLVVDDVALFQLPGHILYGDAVNGKGDAILEPASTRLVSMLKRQESSLFIGTLFLY